MPPCAILSMSLVCLTSCFLFWTCTTVDSGAEEFIYLFLCVWEMLMAFKFVFMVTLRWGGGVGVGWGCIYDHLRYEHMNISTRSWCYVVALLPIVISNPLLIVGNPSTEHGKIRRNVSHLKSEPNTKHQRSMPGFGTEYLAGSSVGTVGEMRSHMVELFHR